MEEEQKNENIERGSFEQEATDGTTTVKAAAGSSTGYSAATVIVVALVIGWVLGSLSAGTLSFAGNTSVPPTTGVATSPVDAQATKERAVAAAAIDAAVFPTGGIAIDAMWGDVVPQLVEKGAIDIDKFTGIFERSGTPLTDAQIAILTKSGSSTPIKFDATNARFMVNTFWAIGLAQNSLVLDEGKMKTGGTPTERFASTGGWTLSKTTAMDYYSKWNLLGLDQKQQERVLAIAENIYRPCCGNSTAFPDCNHGMAMLGLVELMVSQGASDDVIYKAAQAANTYWFPQVTSEIATYFKEIEGVEWADVDPEVSVGNNYMSGGGSRRVRAALQAKAVIPAPATPSGGGGSGGGGGCGA